MEEKKLVPLFLQYVNNSGNKGYYWCEDGDRVREFAEEHMEGWKTFDMYVLEPVESWRAAPE